MDALSDTDAVAAEAVMLASLLLDPVLDRMNNRVDKRGSQRLAAMGLDSDFMTREPILMTTLDIFEE